MSFKGVDASLSEKSLTYQKAENMISKLAYIQLGKNPVEFENVKYPSSFNTVALEEEIDGLLKIMERNFSETLNKTLMKDIARKAITVIPESTKEAIETEIEAGDGVVESIKVGMGMEIEPEKEGDGNINTDEGKSFKTSKQKQDEDSQKRLQK